MATALFVLLVSLLCLLCSVRILLGNACKNGRHEVLTHFRHGLLDLPADRNERSRSPRKKSVDSAPHPDQPVKYLKLCGTDRLFLQDARGHKPAWAGYAVEEKHLFDFKAAMP